MPSFSKLVKYAEQIEDDLLRLAEIQPASAFPEKLLTKKAIANRRTQSQRSFSFFANNYFPPEVHKQGYYPNGRMQTEIPFICATPGFHLILGPRGYAKTVIGLQFLIWLLLTEQKHFVGTFSEDLDKSRQLMDAIKSIMALNPRINTDYPCDVLKSNENIFKFRLRGAKHASAVKPYAVQRSVKGAVQIFDRIEFLLCDDLETEASSLDEAIVLKRRKRLEEAFHSMSDADTMVVMANNHSEDSVYNMYLAEHNDNILPPKHYVHVFRAWDDEYGALWPQRYPACSEEELQALHGADDEYWSGNYQQEPEAKGGYIFTKSHWHEYTQLPDDAIGIGYCDPNLALKTETSDTTAMGALLYSAASDKFFAYKMRCKPYSDAGELLRDYLDVYDQNRVALLGFDGHVDQEAEWTNFVWLYCRQIQKPYPRLDFRRYRVDMHAKSAQLAWIENRILWPAGMRETENGQRIFKQITKFKGKKNKSSMQKVDAADWLICAFQFIHDPEINLGQRYRRKIREIKTYDEPWSF